MDWVSRDATLFNDPADPPGVRSVDPGDDYLISLATAANAMLVSGDGHLLFMPSSLPIHSPSDFFALIGDKE